MPRVQVDRKYFNIRGEVFGRTNRGKTIFLLSVCNFPGHPAHSNKSRIVLFTNEPTYGESLNLLNAESIDRFDVFFHSSLEEFENDWIDFLMEMGVLDEEGTPVNDRNRYRRIREEVHAILIDEAKFLYDGYIMRRAVQLGKLDPHGVPQLRQPDYGVPRNWFIQMFKPIMSMPCHVLMASKVKPGGKMIRHIRADGTPGSLQWQPDGSDAYTLPPGFVYDPSFRLHVFEHTIAEPTYNSQTEEWELVNIPSDQWKYDELGRLLPIRKYFGEFWKQKADREVDLVIERPTVKKVMMALARIRRKVIID